MTSAIDATKPAGPVAYTADVRANFAAAKSEIEALQLALDAAEYLPLTGGTLTGPLTVDVGPDQTNAFVTGSFNVGAPDYSAGYVWLTSGGAESPGTPGISISRIPGEFNTYLAFCIGSSPRFLFQVGSVGHDDETGGNAGSDFGIQRFADDGNFLDVPFAINRATGNIILANHDPSMGVYIYTGTADGNEQTTDSTAIWLETGNSAANSGPIGIGSGRADSGSSGYFALYTGNSVAGSGDIIIGSGDSATKSGDIRLIAGAYQGGTATSQTRGSIILDAVVFVFPGPDGAYIHTGDAINAATADTQGIWIESGTIVQGQGNASISGDAGIGSGFADSGNSGTAWLYTGNTGSGTSGNVLIDSGNSSGGNSGDIRLTTGTAPSGTRGSVIIDAPTTSMPGLLTINAPETGPGGSGNNLCIDTPRHYGQIYFPRGDGTFWSMWAAPAGSRFGFSVFDWSGDFWVDLLRFDDFNRMLVDVPVTFAGTLTLEPGADITSPSAITLNAPAVVLPSVPSADPANLGQLWADPAAGFALKVSQG